MCLQREPGSDEPGSAILGYRHLYADSNGNFYQEETAANYVSNVHIFYLNI
jgi:hypothetical protein